MIIRKNLNKLPNKHYVIHFDKENEEYYGIEIETPKVAKKIYRDNTASINRWKESFENVDKNLGILVNGIAGSGKSLLAYQFFKDINLPVLHIRESFSGNQFTHFINSINQKVILFFDEFEKVYEDDKSQEELLTLFDGGYKSKKIFFLVSNKNKLNEYFYNRPSRIRFLEEFHNIESEVLSNIIDDLLEKPEYESEIREIVTSLGEAGNDLIISLIEQVNLENKSPRECLKHMNIKQPKLIFNYEAYIVGDKTYKGIFYGHPLGREKLSFNQWNDHFDYSHSLNNLKKEKSGEEIILSDGAQNTFIFKPQRKFDFKQNL